MKCSKIHVFKVEESQKETKWVVDDATKYPKSNCIKMCCSLSIVFPGNNKAKIQKDSCWWKMRNTTMEL